MGAIQSSTIEEERSDNAIEHQCCGELAVETEQHMYATLASKFVEFKC